MVDKKGPPTRTKDANTIYRMWQPIACWSELPVTNERSVITRKRQRSPAGHSTELGAFEGLVHLPCAFVQIKKGAQPHGKRVDANTQVKRFDNQQKQKRLSGCMRPWLNSWPFT